MSICYWCPFELDRLFDILCCLAFGGSFELGVGGWVLVGGWLEVQVLDDERTSIPAIFKGPRAVSHPTCCSASLERCDRCDLLVGLEGFHLITVARRASGLALDIESCDRHTGCPGCGVIAQGARERGGGRD